MLIQPGVDLQALRSAYEKLDFLICHDPHGWLPADRQYM